MEVGQEIFALVENDKREVRVEEFIVISSGKVKTCCYLRGDKNQKMLFLPTAVFYEDHGEVYDKSTEMHKAIHEIRKGYNMLHDCHLDPDKTSFF